MDVVDHSCKSENSMNQRVHFEVPPNEVDPVTHSRSGSSEDLGAIEKVLNGHSLESKQPDLQTQGPTSSGDNLSSSVWSTQSGSTAQLPPIQLVGQPAGYDPNRIPSSIFASKPTTPMEWSSASNESLFSIHIGNNSFSRDHFIMFNRSQELTRTDELIPIPATFPDFTESEHDKSKGANVEKDSGVTKASNEITKVVRKESPGDDRKERVNPAGGFQNFFNLSYHSDASSNSTRSFNFPIYAGDSAANSPRILELEIQQPDQQLLQKSQPLKPQMTSKPTRIKWFHCFSCFPRCCR
ncbi:hypothetical protein ACB098_01G231400 [Castanea mollissima]